MYKLNELASFLLGAVAGVLLGLNHFRPVAAFERINTIDEFSEVLPTDWAFQALKDLVVRYSCEAGYPSVSLGGNLPMSRYEMAALLHACLGQISEETDQLKRLITEFETELAVINARVDALEAEIGVLDAQTFSTTTKLSGEVTFVVGGNQFLGSDVKAINDSRSLYGATTFNFDMRLHLETSYTGNDLLSIHLRSGNFDDTTNSFFGAGPTTLSTLEVSYLEPSANIVALEKIFYQTTIGAGFSAVLGARIEQTDLFAMWPSVYPSSTVLDWFTLSSSPTAYNNALGNGGSIWWQSKDGFTVTAAYLASYGQNGDPAEGGLATQGSLATGSVQLGYVQPSWAISAVYSRIQNGPDAIPYATNFTLNSFQQPGLTHAVGLGGYWQPIDSGWIPSVSAGWSFNTSTYNGGTSEVGLVTGSQSWSVGLQWSDVFIESNAMGLAFGQPPFATRLGNGEVPDDGNFTWEWWYAYQVTDYLVITPALFYLSRPLGADTAAGTSFSQLGILVKSTFKF